MNQTFFIIRLKNCMCTHIPQKKKKQPLYSPSSSLVFCYICSSDGLKTKDQRGNKFRWNKEIIILLSTTRFSISQPISGVIWHVLLSRDHSNTFLRNSICDIYPNTSAHSVMSFLYLHNCWQFSCVCLNKNCSVLIHYLKLQHHT